MLNDASDMFRSKANAEDRQSLADDDELIACLLSGGDSRLAVDPVTGTNKYLCPPTPAPRMICASSCTASPITERGFQVSAACYRDIVGASSSLRRAQRLAEQIEHIKQRLLQHFRVADVADAILCPSGTDALLTAAMLLSVERQGEPITAILPAASETGTGVPAAVACRPFDGAAVSDKPLIACDISTVQIALRRADGSPRPQEELTDAYVAAAAAAVGRPVVYLTYGTKTGLIAPAVPPRGVDVIVDACQARIEATRVASYVLRGWPVVVTGSKFFGGPPFSGAVLFPRGRLAGIRRGFLPRPLDPAELARETPDKGPGNLGMVLRWMAALDTMERFSRVEQAMPAILRDEGAAISDALAGIPALVPVSGLQPGGVEWGEMPSIFTFAVRDPADPRRLLSAAELRPLYERLTREGVLLGQPVGLGLFGGLRVAVGARDAIEPKPDRLRRIFDVLAQAVTPAAPRRSALSWTGA